MDVRICIPDMHDYLKIEKNGSEWIVEGVDRWIYRNYFASVDGLNASFIILPSIGTLIDNVTTLYSDCIGSLQSNESDLIFGPLVVPVFARNITHTLVDGMTRMGIVSGYDSTARDRRTTHVMEMVMGFDAQLWLIIVATLMVFGILFAIGLTMPTVTWPIFGRNRIEPLSLKDQVKWIMRTASRKNVLAKTLRTFFSVIIKQHGNVPELPDKRSIVTIFFWLDLFIFFASFYLTGLIKTDMVVVELPYVVDSYAEVLNVIHERRPIWAAVTNDVDEFRDAKPGSNARKIYEYAEKMGINDSLQGSEQTESLRIGHAGLDLKITYLAQEFWARGFPKAICCLSRSMNIKTHIFPLLRFDEEAPFHLKGNIQNHLITGSKVSNRINHRMQAVFEAGMHDAAYRMTNFLESGFDPDDLKKNFSSIQLCMSNVVAMEETP
jgi:hypothetical protein